MSGASGSESAPHPSMAPRIVVGVIVLIGLLILLVGLPYFLIQFVAGLGISSDLPLGAISVGGAVIAALSALAYVVKPTRAYGPVSAVRAISAIVYLLLYASFGAIHATIQGAAFTVTYGQLFVVFVAVPAIALAAAILTTIEDARHPGERIRYDFPSRSAGSA